jgi:hypothetical protein
MGIEKCLSYDEYETSYASLVVSAVAIPGITLHDGSAVLELFSQRNLSLSIGTF